MQELFVRITEIIFKGRYIPMEISNRIYKGHACSGKTTRIIQDLQDLCLEYPKIKICVVEKYPEITNSLNKCAVVKPDEPFDLLVINLPDIESTLKLFFQFGFKKIPVWAELLQRFDYQCFDCKLSDTK